jgi:hypothetical protein
MAVDHRVHGPRVGRRLVQGEDDGGRGVQRHGHGEHRSR